MNIGEIGGRCVEDSPGIGWRPMAGACEHGDETSSSGARELVRSHSNATKHLRCSNCRNASSNLALGNEIYLSCFVLLCVGTLILQIHSYGGTGGALIS